MMTENAPRSASSALPQDQFAPAYKVLSDAIDSRAFPGCSFGVLAGDRIVLQGALGRLTYDDTAELVKPETLYDIASLTKVVSTTAAAMLLAQRGVLDIDLPLGELLPGFVVGRPPAEHARLVTIRNLLAHNSGLPGYVELFRSAGPDELLRACLQLPLEAEPGARVEYSDIGFILLGKALAVLTREPLGGWVSREVFNPLGLNATAFNPPRDAQRLIPPTEVDNALRHRRIQGEVQDEHAWLLDGVAGHAGLFSNVPDFLRFSKEILSAAQPESSGATLFVKETIDCFAERQGPAGSSRALGWDTPSENSSSGKYFSAESIGHLGYSGCSLWIDLKARIAVVLLTNRTWPDRQSQLIREVRPAFHNSVRESMLRW
ncbi:MAG: serine hydrolase domain-containing protein [Terracidiphilus sp.]